MAAKARRLLLGLSVLLLNQQMPEGSAAEGLSRVPSNRFPSAASKLADG